MLMAPWILQLFWLIPAVFFSTLMKPWILKLFMRGVDPVVSLIAILLESNGEITLEYINISSYSLLIHVIFVFSK